MRAWPRTSPRISKHHAPSAARRRARSITKSINSQRLYRQSEDGKREYLSDAELAKQRIDAAKAVEAICGPQG